MAEFRPLRYSYDVSTPTGITTFGGDDTLPIEILPFGFNNNAPDLGIIASAASKSNSGVLIKANSNTWILSENANPGLFLNGSLEWENPPGTAIVYDTQEETYTIRLYSETSIQNTYISNSLYYKSNTLFSPIISTNTIETNDLVANGYVQINGNLFVNGNTTTLNAQNLIVSDNIIELRKGISLPETDSGIKINLTTDANGTPTSTRTIKWASNNRFQLTNDGNNYSSIAVFSDKLSVFANTSSEELSSIITDQTGSGQLVFNAHANIIDPNIILSSNNVIANLNAELLNGHSGSYYTTADHLTGTIPSAVLSNSSIYIGNTEISLNRSSGDIQLTGITSIDGSAAKLTNARNIELSGVILGNTSFDGSSNVVISTTYTQNSISLGVHTTGDYASNVSVSGKGLSITGISGEGSSFVVNSNATDQNIPSTIIFRDEFGDFSANIIYAELNGNAKTVSNGIYTTGNYTDPSWINISKTKVGLSNVQNIDTTNASNLSTGTISSNILSRSNIYIGTTEIPLNRSSSDIQLTGITSIDGSAAKLTNARNISLIGGVSGNTSFDGSSNVEIVVKNIQANNIVGTIINDNIEKPFININGSSIYLGQSVNVAPPDLATTTSPGIVQLNDTLTSDSVTEAATANALKTLSDNFASLSSGIFAGALVHVSDTTLIANLNAELLNGQFGSYYTTADHLTGTIPSTVLSNSSIYIGNTQISLNRSSGDIQLTGITSIDGSAAKLTNPRKITLVGGVSGNTFFDGTNDVEIHVTDVNIGELVGTIGNNKLTHSTINIETGNGLNGGMEVALGNTITISANDATINSKGIVELSDSINSSSISVAATANSVKTAYEITNTNAANASFLSVGTVPLGRIGNNSSSNSSFLSGDNTWKELPIANTTTSGIVQLNDNVFDGSHTKATTASTVKIAFENAVLGCINTDIYSINFKQSTGNEVSTGTTKFFPFIKNDGKLIRLLLDINGKLPFKSIQLGTTIGI